MTVIMTTVYDKTILLTIKVKFKLGFMFEDSKQ